MNPGDLGLEAHWWWLVVGTLLAALELVVPGVFFIWLAAAAAITGVVALLLDISLASQFVLFALLALATVYAGRRWYRNNPVESSDPKLNDRAARLIGQSVSVVSAVDEHGGRVRVGDSEWSARGGPAEAGERVVITGIDGNCLLVEPRAGLAAPKE